MIVNRSLTFSKGLLKHLKNIIEDGSTKEVYRRTSSSFTRERVFTFSNLVYFLLGLGKSSNQEELDIFFSDKRVTYTKGALTQYRSKLNPKLFIHLNNEQCSYYYKHASRIRKWKGFRLIGIDGSTLQLPYSKELVKGFGHFETRTENGRKVVLARISQAYDVLNQISIDAQIKHYRTSELSLCENHLPNLCKQDLLLMDRAYAAYWLMSKLESEGKSFVIRVKANRWKKAKAFLDSNKKSELIEVSPSKEAIYRCKERQIPTDTLKLRLVRVSIESGEDQVLITNLIDKTHYLTKELQGLYRKRWAVEESFKLLKTRAELENLSGKTARSVLQDFHRIILRANIGNIIAQKLTEKGVKTINKKRKKHYQINRTQAYRKTKILINWMLSKANNIKDVLEEFAFLLVKQVEIVRENRSIKRVRRYAARPANFIAYKP